MTPTDHERDPLEEVERILVEARKQAMREHTYADGYSVLMTEADAALSALRRAREQREAMRRVCVSLAGCGACRVGMPHSHYADSHAAERALSPPPKEESR